MEINDPIKNPKPLASGAESSKIENPSSPHAARIELLISTLLRIGVTLSLSIVVLGTIVTFIHHSDYRTNPGVLPTLTQPEKATFPHTLHAVVTGLAAFTGQSLVILGLILLIATPILRVAISIFIFLHDHDRIFVYITSLVLALLLLSFVLGKAGG